MSKLSLTGDPFVDMGGLVMETLAEKTIEDKIRFATDVYVDVSLNIDFDIMFTEPAPLDALIQRFGRINRRRKKGICPVYVCSKGGENDHYIYPKEIVNNTMNVLRDTSVIKESKLQQMLDTVYPDFPEKDKYYKTKTGFLKSLSRLMLAAQRGRKRVLQKIYRRFRCT